MAEIEDANGEHVCRITNPSQYLRTDAAEVADAIIAMTQELAALRLVHIEARELVGEADATGTIPLANIEALRALLHRATAQKERGRA